MNESNTDIYKFKINFVNVPNERLCVFKKPNSYVTTQTVMSWERLKWVLTHSYLDTLLILVPCPWVSQLLLPKVKSDSVCDPHTEIKRCSCIPVCFYKVCYSTYHVCSFLHLIFKFRHYHLILNSWIQFLCVGTNVYIYANDMSMYVFI